MDKEWYEVANCATTDPEVMFPEKGGSTRLGKKVCEVCTVRAECLADALSYGVSEQRGIAGGLDAKARKAILRAAAA